MDLLGLSSVFQEAWWQVYICCDGTGVGSLKCPISLFLVSHLTAVTLAIFIGGRTVELVNLTNTCFVPSIVLGI